MEPKEEKAKKTKAATPPVETDEVAVITKALMHATVDLNRLMKTVAGDNITLLSDLPAKDQATVTVLMAMVSTALNSVEAIARTSINVATATQARKLISHFVDMIVDFIKKADSDGISSTPKNEGWYFFRHEEDFDTEGCCCYIGITRDKAEASSGKVAERVNSSVVLPKGLIEFKDGLFEYRGAYHDIATLLTCYGFTEIKKKGVQRASVARTTQEPKGDEKGDRDKARIDNLGAGDDEGRTEGTNEGTSTKS